MKCEKKEKNNKETKKQKKSTIQQVAAKTGSFPWTYQNYIPKKDKREGGKKTCQEKTSAYRARDTQLHADTSVFTRNSLNSSRTHYHFGSGSSCNTTKNPLFDISIIITTPAIDMIDEPWRMLGFILRRQLPHWPKLLFFFMNLPYNVVQFWECC